MAESNERGGPRYPSIDGLCQRAAKRGKGQMVEYDASIADFISKNGNASLRFGKLIDKTGGIIPPGEG